MKGWKKKSKSSLFKVGPTRVKIHRIQNLSSLAISDLCMGRLTGLKPIKTKPLGLGCYLRLVYPLLLECLTASIVLAKLAVGDAELETFWSIFKICFSQLKTFDA
ncbi:hypothetical protein ZOSMA_4G01170 [Zostera marina]|uniref:Uncharacterized protein n=1 Tax=Zostera marina TaxID=29655 RepID=A0A0K9NYP4_ZOSMR|nr:hypothetical protein ZOSMA_4G01170 [Zostera marina]